uniref:Peptidase S26 domain-containing protein n=1 Tax=Xiphophorus couchianus TaxID=32473 RepID=A0A3B5L011_9TELE
MQISNSVSDADNACSFQELIERTAISALGAASSQHHLSVDDYKDAELSILQHQLLQAGKYGPSSSRLVKLAPEYNTESKLIRVGGRLRHSEYLDTEENYKNRYVRVPDGHLWIEGDHRGHSLDSNCFGPVSLGLLHGRASHIIWPPNRWQRIKPSLPPNREPLAAEEDAE